MPKRRKRRNLFIQKTGISKHKGALRHQLGIPEGQTIPLSMLHAAAKKSGKLGRRARLALTLRGFKHKGA